MRTTILADWSSVSSTHTMGHTTCCNLNFRSLTSSSGFCGHLHLCVHNHTHTHTETHEYKEIIKTIFKLHTILYHYHDPKSKIIPSHYIYLRYLIKRGWQSIVRVWKYCKREKRMQNPAGQRANTNNTEVYIMLVNQVSQTNAQAVYLK